MREMGLYILAVALGALLGLSGGIAASFAVGQGGGGSPTESVLPSRVQTPASPYAVRGDKSPATALSGVEGIVYPMDTTQRREQAGRADASTLAGPSSFIPLPSGERFEAMAALSQPSPFVQWSRTQPTTALLMPLGDVNLDGVVDVEDLALMALAFGTTEPAPTWLDINVDGAVDGKDLSIVAGQFGEGK